MPAAILFRRRLLFIDAKVAKRNGSGLLTDNFELISDVSSWGVAEVDAAPVDPVVLLAHVG